MTQDIEYDLAHYDGGLTVHPEPRAKGTLAFTSSGRWELRFKGTRECVAGPISSYAFEADDLETGGCEVAMRQKGNRTEAAVFDLTDVSADAFLGELALRKEETAALNQPARTGAASRDPGIQRHSACGVAPRRRLPVMKPTIRDKAGNPLKIDVENGQLIYGSLWKRRALPLAGAHASVETDTDSRFTMTRIALMGPLALAAKKKTGAHYLVVEAPGEEPLLMAIDPKLGGAARKFALKLNYLAGTQHGRAS